MDKVEMANRITEILGSGPGKECPACGQKPKGHSRREVYTVIDLLFGLIEEALKRGGKVKIGRVGTLATKTLKARRLRYRALRGMGGFDDSSVKTHHAPARRRVRFRQSTLFKLPLIPTGPRPGRRIK